MLLAEEQQHAKHGRGEGGWARTKRLAKQHQVQLGLCLLLGTFRATTGECMWVWECMRGGCP